MITEFNDLRRNVQNTPIQDNSITQSTNDKSADE